MQKNIIFIILFSLFLTYSFFVYTSGTATSSIRMNEAAIKGKLLYQKHNCTSCHQIYGLGGYLGPELTISLASHDYNEIYTRSLLSNGSQRMPNFHLSEGEINELVEFLKYVDATAISYKNKK